MQAGYKPDGWLGLVLGAKIFVDFTKFQFQEAMQKLTHEINQNLQSSKKINQLSVGASPSVMKSSGSSEKICLVNSWSNEKVVKWLNETNCCENIRSELKRFDGRMLCELNRMKHHAPEYFYRSLGKNLSVDLSELVQFSSSLSVLFD
jgi:hypothetical protein